MDITNAVKIIKEAKHLTALTGAGVSAESGIPTFRGKNGLWNKFRPEELATPEAFARNPELVWKWYAWRMSIVFNATPSRAHLALAKLEELGLLKALITQNVDDLHERAGSKKVIHLHGSLRIAKCSSCSYVEYLKEPPHTLPKCPECSSLLRPGVVWFGESLPLDILRKAVEELSKSDAVMVVGTSAVVQPAASLPLIVKENGGKIVEINPERTPLTAMADVSIRGKAGDVLGKILKAL